MKRNKIYNNIKRNVLRAVAVIVLLCVTAGGVIGCNTVENAGNTDNTDNTDNTEELASVSETTESVNPNTPESVSVSLSVSDSPDYNADAYNATVERITSEFNLNRVLYSADSPSCGIYYVTQTGVMGGGHSWLYLVYPDGSTKDALSFIPDHTTPDMVSLFALTCDADKSELSFRHTEGENIVKYTVNLDSFTAVSTVIEEDIELIYAAAGVSAVITDVSAAYTDMRVIYSLPINEKYYCVFCAESDYGTDGGNIYADIYDVADMTHERYSVLTDYSGPFIDGIYTGMEGGSLTLTLTGGMTEQKYLFEIDGDGTPHMTPLQTKGGSAREIRYSPDGSCALYNEYTAQPDGSYTRVMFAENLATGEKTPLYDFSVKGYTFPLGFGKRAVYSITDGENSGIGVYDPETGENSVYMNGLFAMSYDAALDRVWFRTDKDAENPYGSFGYIALNEPDKPVILRDGNGYAAKEGFMPDFEAYTSSCIIDSVSGGGYLTVRATSKYDGGLFRVELYDGETLDLLCSYTPKTIEMFGAGYRFGDDILIPWLSSGGFLKIHIDR